MKCSVLVMILLILLASNTATASTESIIISPALGNIGND